MVEHFTVNFAEIDTSDESNLPELIVNEASSGVYYITSESGSVEYISQSRLIEMLNSITRTIVYAKDKVYANYEYNRRIF